MVAVIIIGEKPPTRKSEAKINNEDNIGYGRKQQKITIGIFKNMKLEKRQSTTKSKMLPKGKQETRKNSWRLNFYSRNEKKYNRRTRKRSLGKSFRK